MRKGHWELLPLHCVLTTKVLCLCFFLLLLLLTLFSHSLSLLSLFFT